jgi:hypothetical protein
MRSTRKPAFRRRVLGCLRHDSTTLPFYHLDPLCEGPGREWWLRNLGCLVAEVGEECVADSILCVEYFPYHSQSFNHSRLRLPSQEYSFQLVREAIRRRVIIVQLRGARVWAGAVPELARYRNCYFTRTTRTAAISPRNCPDGYRRIVLRIKTSGA